MFADDPVRDARYIHQFPNEHSVRADGTDTERELTAATDTTLPEILHELLKHISQKKTHLYQNF